jgi:hypothetical protein
MIKLPVSEYDETGKAMIRHARRAKRYGMTAQQLDKLLAMHPFCWICGRDAKPGKPRYVDHDHKTGRVRGVLCFTCNHRLLGRGLDKAYLHKAAAFYLESKFDGRAL